VVKTFFLAHQSNIRTNAGVTAPVH
jgi:hypothetical protein